MYEPLQSVQNNWGTYGDKGQNIFKLNEAEHKLVHEPLEGTAPVELRQKTSVGGPLAILDSYYGQYTTMPDDAQVAFRFDGKYIFSLMSIITTTIQISSSVKKTRRKLLTSRLI